MVGTPNSDRTSEKLYRRQHEDRHGGMSSDYINGELFPAHPNQIEGEKAFVAQIGTGWILCERRKDGEYRRLGECDRWTRHRLTEIQANKSIKLEYETGPNGAQVVVSWKPVFF